MISAEITSSVWSMTLVLSTQTPDLARGLIEPALEVAFGHVRTGRGLYARRLSALPSLSAVQKRDQTTFRIWVRLCGPLCTSGLEA